MASTSTQADELRKVFGAASGRELIERTVLTRKVFQRLRDIAAGKELPPPARAQIVEAATSSDAAAPANEVTDATGGTESQPGAGAAELETALGTQDSTTE